MLDQLEKIIDKRNSGEISSEEAERLKYELVLEEDGEQLKEFDNGYTTWDWYRGELPLLNYKERLNVLCNKNRRQVL